MKIANKWLPALAVALTLAASASAAADGYVPLEQRLTAEQRRATGLDTLTPEQLAALNAVLKGEQDSLRAQEESRSEARQETRRGTRGATDANLAGLNDGPIRSRATGSISGWEPGTDFTLENGQTWRVLKGSMTLRTPLAAPEILVVPGVMGRWFLQVDEDLPKARVYRVD